MNLAVPGQLQPLAKGSFPVSPPAAPVPVVTVILRLSAARAGGDQVGLHQAVDERRSHLRQHARGAAYALGHRRLEAQCQHGMGVGCSADGQRAGFNTLRRPTNEANSVELLHHSNSAPSGLFAGNMSPRTRGRSLKKGWHCRFSLQPRRQCRSGRTRCHGRSTS